jgi:hypothetical protein
MNGIKDARRRSSTGFAPGIFTAGNARPKQNESSWPKGRLAIGELRSYPMN